MPNIWHIWHIKHKNRPSSGVLNVSKFWDMLQYALKYESIRIGMLFLFNVFLFSFLSPLSSLSSFLFFLILPQVSDITSLTHFNHFFFFSPSLVFSLLSASSHHLFNLMPISVAMVLFYFYYFIIYFFSDLIPGLAVGGLR